MGDGVLSSEDKPRLDDFSIAARAARELRTGMVVNLGFGIPLLVSTFVEPEREVLLHSENGVIGFGPVVADDPEQADPNCINGGGQPVDEDSGDVIHGPRPVLRTDTGRVD